MEHVYSLAFVTISGQAKVRLSGLIYPDADLTLYKKIKQTQISGHFKLGSL